MIDDKIDFEIAEKLTQELQDRGMSEEDAAYYADKHVCQMDNIDEYNNRCTEVNFYANGKHYFFMFDF
jgi:hypothetical protein